MNAKSLVLTLAVAAIGTGCAAPERSRNLNDPSIAPRTMAEQVCSTCHGIDGNSVSPNFPRLAGQMPDYTIEQLKAFRGHSRSDPAGFEYMWGLSRHLTDAQIEGLAAYFASRAPMPNTETPVSPGLATAGREIFEKGILSASVPPCAGCHGASAQGNEKFPRLAGQHADYLVKQLGVFQRTDERPEGAVMKVIAHQLTEANIAAVSAYLQSVPPL